MSATPQTLVSLNVSKSIMAAVSVWFIANDIWFEVFPTYSASFHRVHIRASDYLTVKQVLQALKIRPVQS